MKLLANQIEQFTEDKVLQGMSKALEVVFTTHKLPLAQIWIPCRPSRASYFWSVDRQIYYADVSSYYNFMWVCKDHLLRKGQGVVGKALLSHKPCFTRDVSQLPIAEYPLSHYARHYRLHHGCFAIYIHTKNHDYVLEFFLPPWNTTSGDLRTFLESIFTTTKNHLQGFKISLGGGPGEESDDEVVKISIHDDEQDSFKIFQTFGIQPISVSSLQNETREEQVQNNVADEAVVVDDDDDGQSAEHNDVSLTCSGKRVEMSVEERENQVGEEFVGVSKTDANAEITTVFLPPTTETLQYDIEVVQLPDDESVMGAGRKNELNVVISEQNGVAVTYSEGISSREETSEKERETNKLSREDPGRHVGKKLDDVPDKRDVKEKGLINVVSAKESSAAAVASSRPKKSSGAEKTYLQWRDMGTDSEFNVDVANLSMNDKPDSFETCQTTRIQPVPKSLEKERDDVQSKETSKAARNDDMTIGLLPPMPKSLRNEDEVVVPSDSESTAKTVVQDESNSQQKNASATSSKRTCRADTSKGECETNELRHEDHKQHVRKELGDVADSREEQSSSAVASSSQKISSRAETSKDVYTTPNFRIRREDVEKQFGNKLADAARNLGVTSRSTFQRALRYFKINRWPLSHRVSNASSSCDVKNAKEDDEVVQEKRKKVDNDDPSPTSSTCNLKNVKEEVVYKKRKVPTLSTPAVVAAHPIPNVPLRNDVETVTAYVTYRDDTVMILLTFSSRMEDLRVEVTRELPQLKGVSFKIKYQNKEKRWILIACDEALEKCIRTSLGERITEIEMMVVPIPNQAP